MHAAYQPNPDGTGVVTPTVGTVLLANGVRVRSAERARACTNHVDCTIQLSIELAPQTSGVSRNARHTVVTEMGMCVELYMCTSVYVLRVDRNRCKRTRRSP